MHQSFDKAFRKLYEKSEAGDRGDHAREKLPGPLRKKQRFRALLDVLGRHKFPQLYDPVRGVIRADAQKDCLRDGVAEVTPERLKDPHVRFFLERNPRHMEGEELCCLAPLSRTNFTTAAYRVIGTPPTPWEPLP